ncbi:aminopeptidase N [Flavobacterium sp. 28YEA47A]
MCYLLITFGKFFPIMKKTYLLFALVLSSVSFAQNFSSQNNQIAEAERKSAIKKINFRNNPNTENYDVTYHRLRFEVNPSNYYVKGNVTTYYKAKSNMSTVTFDLADEMEVSSVKQRNTALNFTQNGTNELVITLPAVQNTNVLDSLTIIYEGAPPASSDGFNTYTHAGNPGLYTLSEPFGAKDWWPCKQDLNDKIEKLDVFIKTGSQYVSVSNGLQISAVNNGDGTKTTHFRHNYPIPAYLVAIAVTNYAIYTQQAGTAPHTFPIVNYIYPENQSVTQNALDVTLPIMDLFEQLFETYPFSNEKYGHAQCSLGGGMEHTTVSFMGGFSRELIAHELAHQWFGDKITCGSWKDIWLNEGFASYLAGLVIEDMDGAANFNSWKSSLIDNITSQPGGAVYLTDAEALDGGRIFSSRLSYDKGAMVVHMLRFKLGDTNFFQGVKNYLADPNLAYGYAITENLKTHLEAASGMDLDEFFNDWVYGQGYPRYTITARNFSPGVARFTVSQTQSHASVSFFEMPVPVRVTGAGGQSLDLILDNTTNNQTIDKNVPFVITGITFNPKSDIIARNSTATLGNGSFVLDESVKLYPNPASHSLQLQLPDNVILEKAIFYNALGQVIKETTSQTSWDVSALPVGVNFVKIITDAGTKQMKFIKA